MSEMNSSLIGFLKKKSLFANSPQKQKRNKQQSRDSKKPSESQKSQKQLINNNPERFNSQAMNRSYHNLQKHNSVKNFIKTDANEEIVNSVMIESPVRYQAATPQQDKYKMGKRNFNFKQQTEQTKNTKDEEEEQVKNIWTGIVSKAVTFQSARLQSAQCLESLSVKLQTQISSINYKLDVFRNKMINVLNQEFANLKDKIYFLIERVFQESQNNMRSFMKQQQKIFAFQLIAMRQNLMKQYEKVESMKQQINKPNWKKVAGELLSSQLEQKVENLLAKSKSLTIKHWELKDLGQSKLPALEKQLKNMVRLVAT